MYYFLSLLDNFFSLKYHIHSLRCCKGKTTSVMKIQKQFCLESRCAFTCWHTWHPHILFIPFPHALLKSHSASITLLGSTYLVTSVQHVSRSQVYKNTLTRHNIPGTQSLYLRTSQGTGLKTDLSLECEGFKQLRPPKLTRFSPSDHPIFWLSNPS